MENLYRVAIHFNEDIGYVEYDGTQKTAKVVLDNEMKVSEVEAFLAQEHKMNVPRESLMDFVHQKVNALTDEESFKLVMTRLWGETGVYVDWSRPVMLK